MLEKGIERLTTAFLELKGEREHHTAEGFTHSTALGALSRDTNHSQGQGHHHPGSSQCSSPKMLTRSQREGWGSSADPARVLEDLDGRSQTTCNHWKPAPAQKKSLTSTLGNKEQDPPAHRTEPFWPTFWVQWSRKYLGHQEMTSGGFCHWNFCFHWEKIN